ncbi:NUDIX domain-containing protein [Cytobacillus sp. FJAT-54145]|uniref:NUDIX domain-containing protein n=1 Tax=Cytobacillus spartinae TaxID=3299023 RepID=A0ABW6KI68_9BACI
MVNQIYENWGGYPVKLTWLSKEKPQLSKVTSVHAYCFHQGKILLVKVEGRGFNIPGGHIDEGETPEEALHREVIEEGYVKGAIKYIGALEVSHEENPLFNPAGKYPLIGYQMFYRMDIEECLPFLREHEAISRIWVEPEEIPYVMNDHKLSLLILQDALIVSNPI